MKYRKFVLFNLMIVIHELFVIVDYFFFVNFIVSCTCL